MRRLYAEKNAPWILAAPATDVPWCHTGLLMASHTVSTGQRRLAHLRSTPSGAIYQILTTTDIDISSALLPLKMLSTVDASGCRTYCALAAHST